MATDGHEDPFVCAAVSAEARRLDVAIRDVAIRIEGSAGLEGSLSRALDEFGLTDAFERRPAGERMRCLAWIEGAQDSLEADLRVSKLLDALDEGASLPSGGPLVAESRGPKRLTSMLTRVARTMTRGVAMRVAAFAALPALAVSAALISPGDAIAQERPDGEETIFVAGVGVSPPLEGPFPEEYQGDTITVGVYAHYSAAEGPGGVFSVTHTEADGTLLANLEGQIDCVRVEGQYAVMTGVVTYANTPGVPNGELHEGVVAGIVVEDNGPQDTMIWAFDEIGSSCNDLPAITLVPLKAGNFAVRSW